MHKVVAQPTVQSPLTLSKAAVRFALRGGFPIYDDDTPALLNTYTSSFLNTTFSNISTFTSTKECPV